MIPILERIKHERIYLDGGTGTMLQAAGLSGGKGPELWNLENPTEIIKLHRSYLEAGCTVISTNTFGINCLKYDNYEELIRAAFVCAKEAIADYPDRYLAFDVGPTGRLLQPIGDLPFEEAVSVFAANIRVAADCGADCILIETMNDSYETKAAVLAAKENCDLPVFVTNVFDSGGKLMTGADPAAMIAMLEGLHCDAVGMNCSLGPDQMLSLVPVFAEYASVPIIVTPNAGIPRVVNGQTIYDIGPEQFAAYMVQIAEAGATILGGCCGTTPEYMRRVIEATKDLPYHLPEQKERTLISSYTHAVELKNGPVLIGEHINPTGKKKLKEALRTRNFDYILQEAIRQSDAGVPVLDVNVGLPEIDEPEMMSAVISQVQAVSDTVLQIDTSDPTALERAMHLYNGKPLVNSVNGSEKSMKAVLPLVQKYGGALIVLTIGEDGIPETAEGRVEIAEQVAAEAAKYGIAKKELIVDPLAMTISSDAKSAGVTLEAIRLLKECGFGTSLGVSNISFGLPTRDRINSTFFAMALETGLDCAIMNPFSGPMMDVYYAFRALKAIDANCTDYIAYAAAHPAIAATAGNSKAGRMQSESGQGLPGESTGGASDKFSAAAGHADVGTGNAADDKTTAGSGAANAAAESPLQYAIRMGLKERAQAETRTLIRQVETLSVINDHVIPALNVVGQAFEQKKMYLPQLLMSAEAATASFEIVKAALPQTGESDGSVRPVILATVQGDIHDIGKNIVKVMLESYGFLVYDLGRDVAPETVVEKARETGCQLVGLSALMTTTVPATEETIRQLHEALPEVKTVVGGAVLTQEYADMIHADYYAKDAMDTVRYAEAFYRT
ncbi:MAG: homocysteine S-methyltransferase family protein [Lachnospiraceae bacterium]|nr:homocysteine S-methyltransferase family protein [Lachnospiraceae bacterium]